MQQLMQYLFRDLDFLDKSNVTFVSGNKKIEMDIIKISSNTYKVEFETYQTFVRCFNDLIKVLIDKKASNKLLALITRYTLYYGCKKCLLESTTLNLFHIGTDEIYIKRRGVVFRDKLYTFLEFSEEIDTLLGIKRGCSYF